jgi:acetolactate synthase-1/2/3 large subunit
MAGKSDLPYARVENLTVARCLLRYLELEGVDRIFGIPGAPLLHLLEELKKPQQIRYVICRQETGAAYAADGYARVTGKPGVVLVTSGPGATNALTGAVNAQCSNSSVLVVSGEVPEKDFGKGFLQEGIDSGLDLNAVYRNACQYSAVVTGPADFQTRFERALRVVGSRPRRTAHLSLPWDVASQWLCDARLPSEPSNYRAVPACSSPRQAREALDRLLKADFPLLFLGAGCREALAGDAGRLGRLQAFVEKLGLPVMTSPGAKALFPESHELSLRTYGLAGCEWPPYYLQPSRVDPGLPGRYDCLMVLSCSLGDLATHRWDEVLSPARDLVQVDLDQGVIGRAFPVSLGIVAEVGHFLDDLIREGQASTPDAAKVGRRKELVRRIRQEHSAFREEAKRNSEASPILPQALMKCLGEALPAGAHLFIDAGNCVGWALHYLTADPPVQVHSSLSMGPMGFAVGAALGARLGAPGTCCVGLVGDGAFLMHGSEVSTAAEQGAGVLWVVLRDDDLAMVSQGMNHYYPSPDWQGYYHIGNADLVKFAESLGATAYAVSSPAEFRQAFSQAAAQADATRKPQVIVACINRTEVPPYYASRASGCPTP